MAQPNRYLEQNIKNSTPYVELTQEVIRYLSAKIKNGKALLTLLRELSVYSGPNQGHNDGLARALLGAIKDVSTQDIDRKIVRTSYFLLSDMVSNTCNAGAMKKISTEMIQHLLYETKQANGSRLCMVWRLLSRMVYACESEDLVEGTLINTLKCLKYPEKEKRFLNQKKADQEFENQLHFWTAIFSSLRRIRRAPPAGCINIIFTGCRSSHVQLARHSFYLLKASLESHPYEVGQYFLSNLKDGSFLSRASTDVMSCVYLMESCKAFIISTEADRDTGVPSVGPIEDTLIVVFKMLEDSRMKVRVECVRILTEIPQGPSFKMAVKNIGGPDFVSRLTNSILPHLQKLFVPMTEEDGLEAALRPPSTSTPHIPIGFGEVNLFPLCRACIRIGRYMVLRPTNIDLMSSLTTAELAEEETRLENLVRPLGKELAKLSRAFLQSTVYLPHARCEVLKALLWIMPDNRGRVIEHITLWAWLQNQILLAIPSLGEDLAENLISHIFGRVKVSTFYPEDLLEMAITCAEETVRCFVQNGGNFIGVLIQVWQRLHDYREHCHARLLLLRSLLRAIDTTLWGAVMIDPIHTYTSPLIQISINDFDMPIVSHQQGLLILRHYAFWALGEYVQLWDYENHFKEDNPTINGLCLKSVLLDLSAIQNTLSTQTQSRDATLFLGSSSGIDPSNPGEDSRSSLPPLLSVVIYLLHASQVESPNIVSVCFESLFKIALWCPQHSPLRRMIAHEFYQISASAYSVGHPFIDTMNEDFASLDLFTSPFAVDPRSTLATLDRIGLSQVIDSPSSNFPDPFLCHSSGRKFEAEWHDSFGIRESSLYSLALESIACSKDPPLLGPVEDVETVAPPVTKTSNDIFLGLDFVGDALGDSLPHHQNSGIVASNTPLSAHSSSDFVVDDVELKKLLYQLHQQAVFHI